MEQDIDKTERRRTGRRSLAKLLRDVTRRVKKNKGTVTPTVLRNRERSQPNITIESGTEVKLTEAHTHGAPEDDATDYLAIKVMEAGDGKTIMRPQKGDSVVQVFCDCINPNLEDIDRTAIAVVTNRKQDQTVTDALKVTNSYKPVNQRGISLYHPDDELTNEARPATIHTGRC